MVFGIGTDLVVVSRFRREMERNPALARGLFTGEEDAWCLAAGDPVACRASLFAAKEAVLKALGTGWGAGVDSLDVVVLPEPGGGFRVELGGAAVDLAGPGARVHLALASLGDVAMAFAVIER